MRKRIVFTLMCFFASAQIFCETWENEQIKKSYSVRERTLDRNMMYKFFIENFGNENEDLVIENILNKPSLFGGGCLPYDVEFKEARFSKNNNNWQDGCIYSVYEIGDESFKKMSVLRKAHVDKVCNAYANSPKALNHFLKKQKLNLMSDKSVENIKKVIEVFYSNEEMKKNLTNVTSKMGDLTWEKLVVYLCKSPGWQIL